MIMNTTDSPGLLSRLQKTFRRNYKKTVLSFLLSGININLAASLEMWTKTCGRLPLLLFTGIGFILCFALTFSFLMREERRLKVHALLWGILMTFAYVLGCRMRRDNTALSGPICRFFSHRSGACLYLRPPASLLFCRVLHVRGRNLQRIFEASEHHKILSAATVLRIVTRKRFTHEGLPGRCGCFPRS